MRLRWRWKAGLRQSVCARYNDIRRACRLKDPKEETQRTSAPHRARRNVLPCLMKIISRRNGAAAPRKIGMATIAGTHAEKTRAGAGQDLHRALAQDARPQSRFREIAGVRLCRCCDRLVQQDRPSKWAESVTKVLYVEHDDDNLYMLKRASCWPPPNWRVRCGGNSYPRSEQFRCVHRTRGPLYGRLRVR